jgi:hypothetical protein
VCVCVRERERDLTFGIIKDKYFLFLELI